MAPSPTSVGTNSGGARTGALTVAGLTFTVNQAGTCVYSLSATSASSASAGGTGAFNVIGTTGCLWTTKSNAAWITVISGASGSGNGTVSYSLSPNTGAARSGMLTGLPGKRSPSTGCRRRYMHESAEPDERQRCRRRRIRNAQRRRHRGLFVDCPDQRHVDHRREWRKRQRQRQRQLFGIGQYRRRA